MHCLLGLEMQVSLENSKTLNTHQSHDYVNQTVFKSEGKNNSTWDCFVFITCAHTFLTLAVLSKLFSNN